MTTFFVVMGMLFVFGAITVKISDILGCLCMLGSFCGAIIGSICYGLETYVFPHIEVVIK